MRIVVKIGTSTLAHPGGRLNIRHTEALVKVWSDIKNAGHELIIVSSGATGLGVGKLQISRPKDMVTKQAAAAVGQCELMYTYDKLFAEYSHTVAQLLVTWEDFDHPHRLNNLQNTLERLIQLGAVPVINENDPISTEEYSLGDNDRLGALIAKYTHADLLVLLSDIDGLYTADPHTHPEATLIHRVESVTPEIEQLGGGSNSGLGTGGMSAKLTAAKIATGAGVDMVIANGANANVLYDIVDGKDVGLTQNEYKMVALLGRYAGKVLTYEFITKEIWGPRMSDNNQILRVNMANIRRKIEKNPAEPAYIFTEIGVGYRMADNSETAAE